MHHESMDTYAALGSPVHRLDARAKVLGTLAFTAAAVSEGRQEVAGLIPYLLPPAALALFSGVPAGFLLRRLLIVSPFALVLAGATALFEPRPVAVTAGPWSSTVREGLVTGTSIILKFTVSATALLVLVTTTRMSQLAGAMSSLGMPRLLAMQVSILYRYLFLIVDELERRRRALGARRVGRIRPLAAVGALGSHLAGLFARSLDRAERVAHAMAARGFDGTPARVPGSRARAADVLFVVAAAGVSAALRLRGLWR